MGTASNTYFAKLVAGLVGKKFPSKTGTVILLVIWFGVLLFFVVLATMQTVDYYNGEVAEYTYLYCDGFNLTTDTRTIHVDPNNEEDAEKIREAFAAVSPGEKLRIRTSAYSNEVIEVYRGDQRIYQSVAPQIMAMVAMVIFMLIPAIMLIVIINMKHPSKRWRKIQREFIG